MGSPTRPDPGTDTSEWQAPSTMAAPGSAFSTPTIPRGADNKSVRFAGLNLPRVIVGVAAVVAPAAPLPSAAAVVTRTGTRPEAASAAAMTKPRAPLSWGLDTRPCRRTWSPMRNVATLVVDTAVSAPDAGGTLRVGSKHTTPTGTSWSVVRVPVLSNSTWLTLPANGTRNLCDCRKTMQMAHGMVAQVSATPGHNMWPIHGAPHKHGAAQHPQKQ